MPIFDQGYQHWKGSLSGHAWRWLAITRHGIHTQLAGRYIRLLIILAWMPALVLVSLLAIWGLVEQGALGADWLSWLTEKGITDKPETFRGAFWTLAYSYFFQVELYFIMLLVMLAGPNLISLDLRFNALPLYLSRPLTRMDYFLGKLGVIAGLVAAVAVLPAAAAYVLGVAFSLNLTVVRDTWRLLPGSIAYGLVIVASAGTLMLALSSMSRRSLYVGMAWVGLFVIGWVVATVLKNVHEQALMFDRIRKEQVLIAPPMELEDEDPSSMSPEPAPRRPRNETLGDDEKTFPPEEDDSPPPSRTRPRHGPQSPRGGLTAKERQRLAEELDAAESRARKTDWRPLFSYMADLERIGEALLNTDAAWVQIGRVYESRRTQLGSLHGIPPPHFGRRFEPEPYNERRLAEKMTPQYPWTWSAAVLAVLFGLSLCILSTRVKSLDRLK